MDNIPSQLDPVKLFEALHALWLEQHIQHQYSDGQTFSQCKHCGEIAHLPGGIRHKTGCPVAAAHKALRGEV